ncbi:hypothetical protein [Candidatus Phytoplasma sacchari]|uniref:Uncharacterized protein n=1 Tax=Candidatus Phytoplasma sacchari TaxID=2609813 RepID=A0ABY7M117_9MOLU|nr:hypothetical protein O7R10_01825 [Candidatus Phytoplasma sacchari]
MNKQEKQELLTNIKTLEEYLRDKNYQIRNNLEQINHILEFVQDVKQNKAGEFISQIKAFLKDSMVKSFFKNKTGSLKEDFLTISVNKFIEAWQFFEKEANFDEIIFHLQEVIAVFDLLTMEEAQI